MTATLTSTRTLNDLVTEAHDLHHQGRLTRADYDRLMAEARLLVLEYPADWRDELLGDVAMYAQSVSWMDPPPITAL